MGSGQRSRIARIWPGLVCVRITSLRWAGSRLESWLTQNVSHMSRAG